MKDFLKTNFLLLESKKKKVQEISTVKLCLYVDTTLILKLSFNLD